MWKCNVCNKENNDDRDRCWSCSTARDSSQPQTINTNQQSEVHVPSPITNEHQVDTQATQTEVQEGISTQKPQEETQTSVGSCLGTFLLSNLFIGAVCWVIIYFFPNTSQVVSRIGGLLWLILVYNAVDTFIKSRKAK